MLAVQPPVPTENERVEAWRLHVLVEAGYPVSLAERIATRGDIDLHAAVLLLERGCSPLLAVEIVL